MKKHGIINLRTKFTIGITIIGLCITFVIALIGINLYRDSIKGQYNNTAYRVAEVASGYLTDEELLYYADLATRNAQGEDVEEEIQAVQESTRYREIVSQVDALRAGMSANSIFFCVCNLDMMAHYDEAEDLAGNWNPVYYVLDTYMETDMRMQIGDVGSFEPAFIKATVESYNSGVRSADYFINDGGFGNNISAVYPVVIDGQTAALAVVEVPMTTLRSDTNRFIFRIVLAAVIATAVLLFLGMAYMAKRMVTPIRLVATEAKKFVADNNVISEKLPLIKTRDEIQVLSESLLQMEIDINDYIENLTKATAEKERIGAELNVATQIQADMLPSIFPAFPDRREIDIFATMNPAKEVGGDFYDFFMVDDSHLAIVVADVSGKGVPAALFMVIGKTLIKDHTTPGRDLGEVFTEVNDLLCESNNEGLFITAFEGVLDLVTGEFRFVNAGHEIPFICKKDGVYEPYKIRAGFVLAGMEGMRYKCGSMQLEPGDRIFQYTDGVTEATNKANELYGMERLQKVLCKNASLIPSELLPKVKEDIDEFVGDAPQFDDITMLCLEYKAKMAE